MDARSSLRTICFGQTSSQGLSLFVWTMVTQGTMPAPVHWMVPAFPMKGQAPWVSPHCKTGPEPVLLTLALHHLHETAFPLPLPGRPPSTAPCGPAWEGASITRGGDHSWLCMSEGRKRTILGGKCRLTEIDTQGLTVLLESLKPPRCPHGYQLGL